MDHVDRIRAFNRFYTRRMGLLGRSYLQTGQPLAEVRVLYELAHHPGQTARVLAAGLGLDEGYLSRILKRFAAAGWLARTAEAVDQRAFALGLTDTGQAAFRPLAERSRAEVAALIATLDERERDRLCSALDGAEACLSGAPEPRHVEIRGLRPGDAGCSANAALDPNHASNTWPSAQRRSKTIMRYARPAGFGGDASKRESGCEYRRALPHRFRNNQCPSPHPCRA